MFDVAGHWTARAARHRVAVLWLLFVALAVVCTVVLSLDTTAVLLTPVGLAIAWQLGLPAAPFALTTLWLANTASLLLPVSNLTNLLALHHFDRLGAGHDGYIRLAALPALGAGAGTVAVLWALHRRELCGRYLPDAPPHPHDRVLLRGSGLVCLAVGPLFAYLALEAVAQDTPERLMALLIGVNVGPLVTPWASLATLLWAQRCRAAGIRISPASLAWQGLVCALAATGLALAGLVLSA